MTISKEERGVIRLHQHGLTTRLLDALEECERGWRESAKSDARAEERIEKLELVVEAARRFVEYGPWKDGDPGVSLDDALRALDEEKA